MEKERAGIRIFAIILVIYGIINLLGLANYNDFKLLCKGFPQAVIFSIYIFGVGYGIMCIMCGSKILKLEGWARRTAVLLVLISLLLGLFMNPIMFKNVKSFYAEKEQFAIGVDAAVKSYIILAIIFTLFELSFVWFFTRAEIKKQFK